MGTCTPFDPELVYPFDPELIYVECSHCGEPVLWEDGKSTDVIMWAGMNPSFVDPGCLILSDGCPNCEPGNDTYTTHIVRLRP